MDALAQGQSSPHRSHQNSRQSKWLCLIACTWQQEGGINPCVAVIIAEELLFSYFGKHCLEQPQAARQPRTTLEIHRDSDTQWRECIFLYQVARGCPWRRCPQQPQSARMLPSPPAELAAPDVTRKRPFAAFTCTRDSQTCGYQAERCCSCSSSP